MESKVEFLKQSLLYQMSLGSKELYHSNVWAWLIENDPAFIEAFVPDLDDNTYEMTDVLREYRHRDIIIWLQRKDSIENKEKFFYVIENKIKSLQSKEQLQKYSEDLDKHTMLGGVVTGIRNALQDDTLDLPKNNSRSRGVKWQFVSYKYISQKIRDILLTSTQDLIKKCKSQIEEYCQIIDAIYSVIEGTMNENDKRLNYAYPSYLADLRLQDVFVKLKGSDFMKFVSDRKSKLEELCPKDKEFWVCCSQGFNRGKATLDFKFTNWQKGWDDKHKDLMEIGIQLEENQYRKILRLNSFNKGQDIFDIYKGNWFDGNFDKSKRVVFGNKTDMSPRENKQFDSYGEQFVYQYYNIDKDNNDYETVFNAIVDDLKQAKVVLESSKY